MIAMSRKYELGKRADAMEDTRRRITEAAVELHGTVGPARTTVTAVAERAGVQRHTVYRHFPTDAALFEACSTHFSAQHPEPDLEAWAAIGDPRERLARALGELYAFYEETEHMWTRVLRDRDLVDAVGPVLAPFEEWLEEAARTLAGGWGARGARKRDLEAALRHAIGFLPWRSLVHESGLPRARGVELMGALVDRAVRA